MATLEKIRSKSVFLIVVIGVALLAFIVGDALTNSRNLFGEHNTVAKIGSSKIEYTEYQRKREELNNRLEEGRRRNPEQFANFDNQILGQLALDQLVQEKLLTEAANRSGIQVSGNLLRYYMLENPQSQEVMDIISNLNQQGVSVQTPAQAYEVIFNPKRNGLTDAQMEPFQRAWIAAESKMRSQLAQMIYQRTLVGLVKPNDLDKKALYNDYVATGNVDVAFLPFGELTEKEYPVSDAEIKAAYDKEKELFRVKEETKEISFIAVNVAPSQADIAEATKLATQTVAALSTGSKTLDKNLKKEGVSMTRHALRAADLPAGAVKEYLLTAGGDSARLVRNNPAGFTAIRLISRTQAVDSIQLNIVSAASDRLGKRVMAALNAGLPIDSVTARFAADSVATQVKQWLPLYTADGATNAIPEETLDSLRNAGGKYISLQAGPQGMVMAQITEQKAPVTIYEYDEATYQLGPSTKTLQAEREKLEKFLAANPDAKKFNENAAKSGYNLQKFTVTSSVPAVPRFQGYNQYYPNSRQVVRWVMIDGKEGEVSKIFESKDALRPALYVAAVDDSYTEYRPVDNAEVHDLMARRVRAEKAGDKLVAKYQKSATSVAAAAQAMGTEVRNIPTFRFGMNSGVSDPEVIGMIAGNKGDKKVVITKGYDGVYVYQVLGKNKENFPYNADMYEQQYYQFVNPDMLEMLKGNTKFKNNIYKFEAGE